MKDKINRVIKPVVKGINAADNWLLSKKVYQIVIVGVLIFLFVIFGNNFSSDKVFKNYTEDSVTSIQLTKNSKYKMSFESKESELNFLRIMFDVDRSNLSPSDKVSVTLSDEQGYLLYSTEAYLYNTDRGYIRVDMGNTELTPGEWYYLNMNFDGMQKGSYISLKAHQIFSFNEALQTVIDNNQDDMALDYSIGFNKVPNINYYFNKANYFSMAFQILAFLAVSILLFMDKPMANRSFKEVFRLIVLPIFLYLLSEVLNIEKHRPFQLFPNFSLKYYFAFILSLVVIAVFYFLFYMLTGYGSAASLIVGLICAILAYVNHTKLVMRGDSFMPWDLVSAGIAVKTGSTYYFHVTINFIAGLLVSLMILCFIRLTNTPYIKLVRNRVYLLITAILSTLLVFSGFILNTKMLDRFKIYYQVNPPIQSYNENGTYLAFLMHLNNIKAAGGDNNSPENVNNLIYQYVGRAHELDLDDEVNNLDFKPNVICIMSESYTDLRRLRGFTTSEPIMPYYDSLMNESINGQLAVSIFGGGTCNTEFEFLTGYSVSNLLPGSSVYTFYVNNQISALPSIFRDNGYRTVALHSFDGDWWDRREKYPMLGFDEFYTRDDFDQSARYVRRYISDMSTFEKITSIFEQSEDPLFLFCVTMQNHADFSARYDNMTYDITIDDMRNAEGQNYHYAENYISLIRESDDALEYLIEYLRQQEEPTMVVFFGDHYATLDPGFYDELLQTDLGAISVEESLPIYETPYFIWANFDMGAGGTNLDVSYGNHGVISPNFLGQDVLDLAGIESPDSRACLRVLRTQFSALNSLAIYDINGYPHIGGANLDDEQNQMLDDYATVQYGLIYYEDDSISTETVE